MRIQNNSGAMLEIGGVKIKAKEAAEVADWDLIKGLPVIRAWLRCRILEVVGEASPTEEPAEQVEPELAEEESEEVKTKSMFGLKW